MGCTAGAHFAPMPQQKLAMAVLFLKVFVVARTGETEDIPEVVGRSWVRHVHPRLLGKGGWWVLKTPACILEKRFKIRVVRC